MSVVEDPSYERWLHAYGDVWEALPGNARLPCPRCGVDALRLVFVGDEVERVAYAAFWCDNCLHGIHVSRADVPAGARIHPFAAPDDPRGLPFPDYTVIVSPPDADGKDESDEVLEF
jgi:hypothetical protein